MLTTLKEATLIIWIFQAYLGVDCSLAGECCLHCVEPNKADTSAVKFCGTGAVARVELDDPIFLRGETVDDSPCLVHRQPSEVNRTRCEAISTSEDLQLSHEEKMEALANKWATEMEAGLKQIKESDPGLAKLLEGKPGPGDFMSTLQEIKF